MLASAILLVGCAERALPLVADTPDLAEVPSCGGTAVSCAVQDRCGLWGKTGCRSPGATGLLLDDHLAAALMHVSPQMSDCMACADDDCEAVRRCLNGGREPVACSVPHCDGNVLTTCANALFSDGRSGQVVFDCGSSGLTCFENEKGAECGFAACPLDQTSRSSCDGTLLRYCSAGVLVPYEDCAKRGMVCGVDPHGVTGFAGREVCHDP
jgi:hypothetical protein